MSISVIIEGVTVTKSGALVTSPIEFDETAYHKMALINTAYNFALPRAGKQFILTGFIAVSDKNITADALVEIYEADSETSTTVLKELPKFTLTKNSNVSPTPLRTKVSPGVFVNAKTDDENIYLTMFGYYINSIE